MRSHYVGRTFIEPQQSIRHFGVRLKLNPVSAALEGQARGRGRRQHRPRHDQPQDRQDAARRRRERGAHAHLEPAHAVALLLRHRHADARRADRLEPQRRRDRSVHHERHARLPLARRHEASRASPHAPSPRARSTGRSLPVVGQPLGVDSFCHACWSGEYPIAFVPHPRQRQMRLLDC